MVLLPISVAVVVGGVGFPVIVEVLREPAVARTWSLHTRLTLLMTAVLLVGGTGFITLTEWANDGTLGALGTGGEAARAGGSTRCSPAPQASTRGTTGPSPTRPCSARSC